MKALLEETVKQGYKYFKLKVGTNVEDDKRRLGIARDVIGYDKGNILMVDANQVCSDSRRPLMRVFLIVSKGVVSAGSR